MESKSYELFFIPVPYNSEMQEDFYNFLNKWNKTSVYAIGIELGTEETERDLQLMIEVMAEEGARYTKYVRNKNK